MLKFIHTADWQVGKPYLKVKDDQKRFKLKQERINVISRIRDISIKERDQFVLIAGDLFDSPTPSPSSVLEVLEAIGTLDIPVMVIPGNHDHGALGTIWHREDFCKYKNKFAPNLKVLLDREPFEIDDAIILPCPLIRNQDSQDPTIWLRNFDWAKLCSRKPRIILAHGGVYEFTGSDYLSVGDSQVFVNNLIDLNKLPFNEIDYIALGDWHNLKKINQKSWYSGTPEPDRFDQGDDNHRGQVLHIELERGASPKVSIMPTGVFRWHNLKCRFSVDRDLDILERQIDKLSNGRVSKDLLRIEISGSLSFAGYQRFEQLKDDLEQKFLRLRIKGECQQLPKTDELEYLTSSVDDPLIAEVALQLKKRLELEENLDSENAIVGRAALSELFRLVNER